MEKFNLLLLFLFSSIGTFAQTVVEDRKIPSASALLEFPTPTIKGLILPAVLSAPNNPSNGTFVFDREDKIIKVFENNQWLALSGVGSTTNMALISGHTTNNSKTVIGNYSSTANGVMVLESKTKALVLPTIESPHLNVPTPYPGMMCYDKDRKALAVYDGKFWNYWK